MEFELNVNTGQFEFLGFNGINETDKNSNHSDDQFGFSESDAPESEVDKLVLPNETGK